MAFDPLIAACRFGCGLSPSLAPPNSVDAMLARLDGPDVVAAEFPIESFETFNDWILAYRRLRNAARKARGTDTFEEANKAVRRARRDARQASVTWFHNHLMRRTWTDDGLRERLNAFWADHFTTRGRGGLLRRGTSPYVETAIRPRLTGSFADLLIAAVTHPMMVDYLDQTQSMGDDSPAAQARRAAGRPAGLNENLAREVLELHTLGVGGPYTQTDVRELAELFSGLTFRSKSETGRVFLPDQAAPGAETVLGRTYGGDDPSLADIEAVLRDLARHPATARHIAQKLAVHFVADMPDPDLVDAMEHAFLDSDGRLFDVYRAMLTHPAAWDPTRRNVKPAFDFISSSFRALGVHPRAVSGLKERDSRKFLIMPLRAMGHSWENPVGPDGLYEADGDWITPQGLAVRIQWAMRAPRRFSRVLPDPRSFVDTALGRDAPDAVRFAARSAESVPEAIGLVLMSPGFQRV